MTLADDLRTNASQLEAESTLLFDAASEIDAVDILRADRDAAVAAVEGLEIQLSDQDSAIEALTQTLNEVAADLAAQTQQSANLAALVNDRDNEIAALVAQVTALQAELENCGEPSPSLTRVMEADGPDGRGGWNGGVFFDDGTGLIPSDVGGLAHIDITGRAHKCNQGLPEPHVAGVTKIDGHRALVVCGTAGKKNRAIRIFDTETHRCGPSFTNEITVRSQNSAGWGSDIGASDVRSCGAIAYMRANGDIVVGSFQEGVKVWHADSGNVTTVAGTEGWEVRSLVPAQGSDDAFCFVGTWSDGGWIVDVSGGRAPEAIIPGPTVEAIATNGATELAVCRNNGIHERTVNGSLVDITYNAPRDAWWTGALIGPDGTYYVSCARPKTMNGAPCSVLRLLPGSKLWDNLTAYPIIENDLSTGDRYWGFDDVPGKCLGGSGAVVNELAMTPDGRLCAIGAGGVLWYFDGVQWVVASKGMGIISFRDMAASEDGRVIAWACMDYRGLVSWDGGDTYHNLKGDTGNNDGNRVEIDDQYVYMVTDGGEKFRADWTQVFDPVNPVDPEDVRWSAFSGTLPAAQPENRAHRSGNTLTLDGEDISDPMLARFGGSSGILSVGDEVWLWNHGCLRSHLVVA